MVNPSDGLKDEPNTGQDIAVTPDADMLSPEQWEAQENGLQRHLTGVHLGRVQEANGRHSFKDDSETLVSDGGFIFGVSQASYGFTGLYVRPTNGVTVEALGIDKESKRPAWNKPAHDDKLWVSQDYGNLQEVAPEDWGKDGVLGNEGIHAGIIRVKSEDGATRYFLLGADFQGDLDDWNVTGKLIEVKTPEALDTAHRPIGSPQDSDLGAKALEIAHDTVDRSNE